MKNLLRFLTDPPTVYTPFIDDFEEKIQTVAYGNELPAGYRLIRERDNLFALYSILDRRAIAVLEVTLEKVFDTSCGEYQVKFSISDSDYGDKDES